MKVLIIGHDPSLFEEGSATQKRMAAYGSLVDELTVIGLSDRIPQKETYQIAPNVRAYPTRSHFKLSWVRDAVRLGRGLPKPDLITAQDIECGLAARRLARHFGVPFQQQIHTDIFSKEFHNTFLNRLRQHFASGLLRDASGVRVVSERIKQSIIARGIALKQEPLVLPLFVDTRAIIAAEPHFKLHDTYPEFNFIVLMVSRLAPEKDFPTALRAFKGLLAKDTRAGLVIVGSGEEQDAIARKASAIGCAASVRFVGAQSDVVSYFKTADVLLVTSRYEGYGRIFAEAAAAGCPVVSTDVGAVRELFTDGSTNAIICPVGDVSCLTSGLSVMMTDHQTRVQMRFRAKEELIEHNTLSHEAYLAAMKAGFEKCLVGA